MATNHRAVVAVVSAAFALASCDVGTSGAPPSAAAPAATARTSYATDFDGTEHPLSEGGAWLHRGVRWTRAVKDSGIAHGTQTGRGGYDDSYAYLSGFPPDHAASAVLYVNPNAVGNANREVELLLRWSDAPLRATGYECTIHFRGAYAMIVRWDGPYGKFTHLARASAPPRPKSGDVMKATIVGDVITVYYNGVQLMQARDATYASGNPGIGFYIDPGAANDDFGFTSYTAQAL